MNLILLLLVDADTHNILANWRLTQSTSEKLMIFGAIGLVTALVVLWAVFLRKKRRRRRSHHHEHHGSSVPAQVPGASKDASGPAPEEHHRRHRRSRRRHRRLNPTLAETGGLPPIRPEAASDPEP